MIDNDLKDAQNEAKLKLKFKIFDFMEYLIKKKIKSLLLVIMEWQVMLF